MGSKITGTVYSTVILGKGGYHSPLRITSTGAIEPAAGSGDAGVIALKPQAGLSLNNAGIIDGGSGSRANNNAGGAGVDLHLSPATVTDTGRIYGGAGGDEGEGGGAGVLMTSGGTLVVNGHASGMAVIAGGAGGNSYGSYNGAGGAGVTLAGGVLSVESTHSYISGGVGGYSDYGGGEGGAGVDLSDSASGSNACNITGGAGGACGEADQPYWSGGTGGAGVALTGGAMLANKADSGIILGGAGGACLDSEAGGTGGVGVSVAAGCRLINAGEVVGGAGGQGEGFTYYAGNGGAGVALANDARVTNTEVGTIIGGHGGHGGARGGGAGGVGVYVGSGAILTNAGSITGGAGTNMPAGVGVNLNGGTLINSGTISGGGAGIDAVSFGNIASMLEVGPGALFNGVVAANTAADDVLLLGNATGTLTGLGTAFTGFTTYRVARGSDWTLTGANVLGAGTVLDGVGALAVSGSLVDFGTARSGTGGDLAVSGSGSLQLASVRLHGGALTGSAGGTITVGASAGGPAGIITVENGASLTGFGTVTGAPIVDQGIIASADQTLTLATAVSGGGTIMLDTRTTLVAGQALGDETVLFHRFGATLVLDQPSQVASTEAGFYYGDKIDLVSLQATSLSFVGGVLDVLNGTNIVDTLTFSGSYETDNFVLSSDGNGGSDISFAAGLEQTGSGRNLLSSPETFGAAPYFERFAGAVSHADWLAGAAHWI